MNPNDHFPVIPCTSESVPSVPDMPTIPVMPMLELEPRPTPPAKETAPAIGGAFTAAQPEVFAATPAEANMARADHRPAGLWNRVLPIMLLMSLFVLILYAVPYLLYHWRMMDAHADADSAYTKRRAELKAETEHADEMLDKLDKRVVLTSLGFREVVRKVAPNVVNVANFREPKAEEMAHMKKNLIFDWENDHKYIQAGVGSGLILEQGVILTNYHVVKDAQRLRISFASGQTIGIDPSALVMDAITDLAVIRLPKNLPAGVQAELQNKVVFADSDKDVEVGDWALAIGSPLGLKQTVTQGVISAKGRLLNMLDIDKIELLQTDAAIFPGNSGGPLFDQYGRVMGINVAIASDNGGNQGIGFAIPSNTVKRICELLLAKGEVPRGYLGIAMDELPGPQVKLLKIDDGAVVVKHVIAGEAASRAGLQPGDIIVRINKESINRVQPIRHFRQIIVDLEPGTEATVEIVRNEERHQIPITVGKRPANLP
jgi:S1-C subfamily serine protease